MMKHFSDLSAPGPIAQSVANPTVDPEVAGSIPVRSYTFLEIDPEKSWLISKSGLPR